MSDLFNVVFAGQIAQGADPAAVRANVARLFKASDAMVDKLFSGQRIAVKKAVDQATAMKLRAMLKQAGAIAALEACDATGRALAPPPAAAQAAPTPPIPVAAAPAQPAPRSPTMAERIAVMDAANAKAEALKPKADAPPPPADVKRVETWRMFPPGSLLVESKPMPAAPLMPNIGNFTIAKLGTELMLPEERKAQAPPPVVVPDLSAIKVAPVGGSLLNANEKPVQAAVVVDISSMSMAPPNTDVLKENEKRVVVPVMVDVSGITVAPPGADLEQIREEKVLVNPDISKIRLA